MIDKLFEVKDTMGRMARFCLDNMNKPLTPIIQAEFNILYNQYHNAILIAEENGISEQEAIKLGTKCPVEIPEKDYFQFEKWFIDRLKTMISNQSIGFEIN